MSNLKYNDYDGAGETFGKAYHYSQAVVLGDIIKCSGQGGWDAAGNLDANDDKAQVQLAIANVDKVLRAAGSRGWEDVYSMRTYHTDIDASLHYFVEGMKERIPGFRPVFTAVGVRRLALPEMIIEVEVEAYVGKS